MRSRWSGRWAWPAGDLRGGWGPAADRLARHRTGVARSGHGPSVLGTTLGSGRWDERGDAVQDGDYLLVSQFYNGSMMMQLHTDRPAATMLWKGASRSEMPDKTEGCTP